MLDLRAWRRYPATVSYVLAILSVGAALLIGRVLDHYFSTAPASLFISAITLTAWLGGLGPGLLATTLSLFAFKYYSVPPLHSLALETADAPRLVVFLLTSIFVASLSAGQRKATAELRESERRFRDYAETASDWLWETGPDHSFTWLSEGVIGLGITSSRIGAKRWTFATDVAEETEKWGAHVAMLEAREPFRNFVWIRGLRLDDRPAQVRRARSLPRLPRRRDRRHRGSPRGANGEGAPPGASRARARGQGDHAGRACRFHRPRDQPTAGGHRCRRQRLPALAGGRQARSRQNPGCARRHRKGRASRGRGHGPHSPLAVALVGHPRAV